jgi:hypothetical protein
MRRAGDDSNGCPTPQPNGPKRGRRATCTCACLLSHAERHDPKCHILFGESERRTEANPPYKQAAINGREFASVYQLVAPRARLCARRCPRHYSRARPRGMQERPASPPGRSDRRAERDEGFQRTTTVSSWRRLGLIDQWTMVTAMMGYVAVDFRNPMTMAPG